jgi:hypothetical protein
MPLSPLYQRPAETVRPQNEADRALNKPNLDRDLHLRPPLSAQFLDPMNHLLVDLCRHQS